MLAPALGAEPGREPGPELAGGATLGVAFGGGTTAPSSSRGLLTIYMTLTITINTTAMMAEAALFEIPSFIFTSY